MEAFAIALTQVIASIPSGKVATYGQLARLAGYPGYARQVGRFLKHLPTDTTLPWHRVINSQGRISFPIDSPGYLQQVARLQTENIVISQGKVALKRYLWNNP